MANQKDLKKRAQEMLAKAKKTRPDLPPVWTYVAGVDPEYVGVFDDVVNHVLNRKGALPRKTKEMILSVILASRIYERTGVHLEKALDTGATEAELVEALEVAAVITGAPTMLFGADLLSKIVAKRKDKGI